MSVLQAFMQGRQARQQENQMMRQNMMQQYMQQNAQGIMSGDQGAIGGLAEFDPMMALNIGQTHRQNARADAADARAGEMHNAQLGQIRARAAKEAEIAAKEGKLELDAKRTAMLRDGLTAGYQAYEAGDQEAYNAILRKNMLDPEQYPMDQFPMYAAQVEGLLDAVKGIEEVQGMNQPEPGFRMATPEEAAERGATGGQFGPDGRFYPAPTQKGGAAMSFDPETGKMVFMENAGEGFGTSATNMLEKKQIDAGEALARVNDIRSSFKPEYLQIPERIGFAWDALTEKMGAELPPEAQKELADYSTFKATAISNINRTLNELSGAAVSPQEATRLRNELPDPGDTITDGDSPTEFAAKMNRSVRTSRMAIARYNLWQKQGGVGDPWDMGSLEDVPKMIDRRGDQIAEELKARGITDPEVLSSEVTKQLNREVWGE